MDRYLVNADGSPRPLPKQIFCIRHGQSEANARLHAPSGADRDDAVYFDSPLTPVGREQALALQSKVAALKPELVVTSPMTRALETAMAAMGDSAGRVPTLAHPLCTELLCCAADIGSPAEVLRKRWGDRVDFAMVAKEHWWWTKGREVCDQEETQRMIIQVAREPVDHLHQRASDFKAYLKSRPEERIVVFGHSGFFQALQDEWGSGKWIANCEVRQLFL